MSTDEQRLYTADQYGTTCRLCDAWSADESKPCKCGEFRAAASGSTAPDALDRSPNSSDAEATWAMLHDLALRQSKLALELVGRIEQARASAEQLFRDEGRR